MDPHLDLIRFKFKSAMNSINKKNKIKLYHMSINKMSMSNLIYIEECSTKHLLWFVDLQNNLELTYKWISVQKPKPMMGHKS
jgi:hypothetical protein